MVSLVTMTALLLLCRSAVTTTTAFLVTTTTTNPFLSKIATTKKITTPPPFLWKQLGMPIQPSPSSASSSAAAALLLSSSQRPRDEYDDFYADFDPSIEYYQQQKQQNQPPSNPFSEERPPYSSGRRGPSSSPQRRSSSRHGGGNGNNFNGQSPTSSYQRDTSRDRSNVNVPAIEALIDQRDAARKQGQFDQADQIRDVLLNEHGVQVWDRDRVWRSGCSASGSGRNPPSAGRFHGSREGRGDRERSPPKRRSFLDFGVHGHDYAQVVSTIISSSCHMSEPEIHEKIAQRLECKLSRRFRDADAIQQELADAGVYLHDGRKEWRADGERFVAGEERRSDGKPGRTVASRNSREKVVYTPSEYSNHHASVLSSEELIQIEQLVEQRTKAKLTRDYDTADAIRNDLLTTYNVYLDDRLQQWSVGGTFFSTATTTTTTRRTSSRVDRYPSRQPLEQQQQQQQQRTRRSSTVTNDDEEGRRFRNPMQQEENNYDNSDYNIGNEEVQDVLEDGSVASTTFVRDSENASIRYDVLSDLTIPQLKDKLREQGLPVSGKKAELIDRLLSKNEDGTQ